MKLFNFDFLIIKNNKLSKLMIIEYLKRNY